MRISYCSKMLLLASNGRSSLKAISTRSETNRSVAPFAYISSNSSGSKAQSVSQWNR